MVSGLGNFFSYFGRFGEPCQVLDLNFFYNNFLAEEVCTIGLGVLIQEGALIEGER